MDEALLTAAIKSLSRFLAARLHSATARDSSLRNGAEWD